MRNLTAFTYYFGALATSIALMNRSIDYTMTFGGISLIGFLLFTITKE
jgi:hypothetical protein